MSGPPVLAVRDLELLRGRGAERFCLRVDALELCAGETVAVLGPNGSGKSSLLRAMAGLLPLQRGEVVRAADRDVALVFQHPVAFTGSVAHNAQLALWARGVSRGERRRRGAAALETFGIAALARRSTATLSGGELRRLALARAFAIEPRVLLLDEPFDDLDAGGREALSLDLRRVAEETGVAVAMVTHDLRQALLLADRIAVLNEGVLVQSGRRDEVLRRPASCAVARLVGMDNLLPATGVGEGRAGLSRLALAPGAALDSATRVSPGAEVWAGVRPEDVKLEAAHGDDHDPHVGRGVVTRILSDGIVVTAFLDWAGLELRTHLVAGRGLGHMLKRGDPVWISIRPEDVHVMPS